MRFREHRCPCDHPVAVRYPDGRRAEGVLINVSQGGARLARVSGLTPGITLRLTLDPGGVPRDAQVRWVHSGYAGLRFAQRLDSRTMAIIRKSVSHPAARTAPAWNLHLRELR